MVRSDLVVYAPEPKAAAAPCIGEPSARERRAQENADCIGGLRSPWKAVRKLPRLSKAAEVVRRALDREFTRDPKMVEVVDWLGQDVKEGSEERKWLDEKIDSLGEKLLASLGGSRGERDPRIGGSWNADLVGAFVARAADPEADLAVWLRSGCPAGVAKDITSCGIFPPAAASDGIPPRAEEEEMLTSHVEPDGNYASVVMEAELSGAEVDRLITKGYAVRYDTWEDVIEAFGGALVSKLACIVKARDDGTLKVRNVLDLRRSGYNRLVAVPERVVLPRLHDLVEDSRVLMRHAKQGEECFGMVADFEDAFYTLCVDPSEWR